MTEKIFDPGLKRSYKKDLKLVQRNYIYTYKCPECGKTITLKEEDVGELYVPRTMEELTIPCSKYKCNGKMKIVYDEEKEDILNNYGVDLIDNAIKYLFKTGFLKEKDKKDICTILEKALAEVLNKYK